MNFGKGKRKRLQRRRRNRLRRAKFGKQAKNARGVFKHDVGAAKAGNSTTVGKGKSVTTAAKTRVGPKSTLNAKSATSTSVSVTGSSLTSTTTITTTSSISTTTITTTTSSSTTTSDGETTSSNSTTTTDSSSTATSDSTTSTDSSTTTSDSSTTSFEPTETATESNNSSSSSDDPFASKTLADNVSATIGPSADNPSDATLSVDQPKPNIGIIILSAFGALILFVGIVVLLLYCYRRFNDKNKKDPKITRFSNLSKPFGSRPFLKELRFSSPVLPPSALKKQSRYSLMKNENHYSRDIASKSQDKFWERMSMENSHFSVPVKPDDSFEKTNTFDSENIFKNNIVLSSVQNDNPFMSSSTSSSDYVHSIPVFPESVMLANAKDFENKLVNPYANVNNSSEDNNHDSIAPADNTMMSFMAHSNFDSYSEPNHNSTVIDFTNNKQEDQLYPTLSTTNNDNQTDYFANNNDQVNVFADQDENDIPIVNNQDYKQELNDAFSDSESLDQGTFSIPDVPMSVLLTAPTTPEYKHLEISNRNESTNRSSQISIPNLPSSHIVTHKYSPKLPDEVALLKGDLIGIETIYSDGWAQGQNISQGRKKCVFPMSILEPITSGPSQKLNSDKSWKIFKE